jgi:hypothetical protein
MLNVAIQKSFPGMSWNSRKLNTACAGRTGIGPQFGESPALPLPSSSGTGQTTVCLSK